jgi:hypothetical protein
MIPAARAAIWYKRSLRTGSIDSSEVEKFIDCCPGGGTGREKVELKSGESISFS